jgi:Las1-like
LISNGMSSQNVFKNKQLRAMTKWTPWKDHWEFESVGRSLVAARALPLAGRKRWRTDSQEESDSSNINSSNTHEVQQALVRVSVWKVRVENRLAHAVESSHQLALCLWNDHVGVRGTEELRLSYSCVVLRTINGLADAMQQQRFHAGSVAVLCADLGIPSWIVDIRHEATHNQMPSLSVLRLAATTLLEYFHREYWLPQFQAISAGNCTAAQDDTITSPPNFVGLLQAYQRQQEKLLSRNASSSIPSSKGTSNSSGASPSGGKTNKSSVKQVVSIAFDKGNISSNGNSDDQDSDEEMYLDGLSAKPQSAFWSPTTVSLGTNINRFAALLEDSSKDKKKNKKLRLSKNKISASNKNNIEPSAHHHAKQYVKAGMNHLELAQHTALVFLVWGVIGEMTPQGVLIPTYSTEFPETREGCQKIRQHFSILLTVLGKEWPGFLQSLLSHLIDHILLIETSSLTTTDRNATTKSGTYHNDQPAPATTEVHTETTNESTPRRKLFYLDSWVRYLVSREFVNKFHSDSNNRRPSKSTRSRGAAWAALEKMRYPLNSLCDRLLSSPASRDDARNPVSGSCKATSVGTSKGLADLFRKLLGPNRHTHFGVSYKVPMVTETPQRASPIEDKETEPSMVESSASNNAALSLDEMEALLCNPGEDKNVAGAATGFDRSELLDQNEVSPANGDTDNQDSTAKANGEAPAWVRCTIWEPCTIGTLPGEL